MNKEENFINTLFEKTEESEAIKPQTTEIIKMPMSSIVPSLAIWPPRIGSGKYAPTSPTSPHPTPDTAPTAGAAPWM